MFATDSTPFIAVTTAGVFLLPVGERALLLSLPIGCRA